ncbi:MAG: hypothetical protein JWO03_1274 [Bacteroidetes bacterium]|nr:hypothetical protein [Bacteroidota bacterium]
MNKNLLLSLAVLFFSITLSAQEVYRDILDRINNTTYIFEGVVIKTNSYETGDQKMIYTSNVIQVTKIFKGVDAMSCGTVELITDGGQLTDKGLDVSHALALKVGDQGIFLTSSTDKELPVTYYPFTIPVKLGAPYDWQSFIKYMYDDSLLKAYDIWTVYDSLAHLYDLAEYATQLTYVDCSESSLLPPAAKHPTVYPYHARIMPAYSSLESQQAQNRLHYNRTHLNRPKASRAIETLNYRISNVQVTGTSPKYLEYDVNVFDQSNTNHYLSDATIRIVYDPAVFGPYLVTNHKISVTNGAMANPSCYFPVSPNDDNPSTISMLVFAHDYSICKSPITASPQQLVHISMEIQTCGLNSKIDIEDTLAFFGNSYMANGSSYSVSSGDTLSTFYDLVTTDSVAVPSCTATITSFDPPTVNGGVRDVLNIHGFQFGNTRGTGNLLFYNADYPITGMSLGLDDSDYISWSDTLVRMYVPSVDSGAKKLPIGTGKFRIVTSTGDKDTSATPLTVYYSLKNDIIVATGGKYQSFLYNKNGNGGYQFFVDTSVSHKPAIYGVVKKSVQDWICATGVNFAIVRDTFGLADTAKRDGINLITIGPRPSNVLATCFSFTDICTSAGGKIVTVEELDLIISDNPALTWCTDTSGTAPVPFGQSDLYHVVLHELGHGVGHNHVIDPAAIMSYVIPTVPSGGLPPSGRYVNIKVDGSAIDGGSSEVTSSSNPVYVHGCGNLPMVAQPICFIYNGIKNAGQVKVSVYPNPFDNQVTIESESVIQKVTIFSLDGRLVNVWEGSNENQLTLQMPNALGTGVYLMSVETRNGNRNLKIVHE